jgi:hypothetical protein
LNECPVADSSVVDLIKDFQRVSSTGLLKAATIWNRPGKQLDTKNPLEMPSGGSLLLSALPTYAFIAAFTASAVIGSERTRAPQAFKIAFAGATTVTAGSPTLMVTSGI